MRILKARLRPPELACIWGRKSTILQLSNSSDNHLLFHYPLQVPRVNRRARPRLVTITHGYRYLGNVLNGWLSTCGKGEE